MVQPVVHALRLEAEGGATGASRALPCLPFASEARHKLYWDRNLMIEGRTCRISSDRTVDMSEISSGPVLASIVVANIR